MKKKNKKMSMEDLKKAKSVVQLDIGRDDLYDLYQLVLAEKRDMMFRTSIGRDTDLDYCIMTLNRLDQAIAKEMFRLNLIEVAIEELD